MMPDILSNLLLSQRKQMTALADSWLASGATSFCLWSHAGEGKALAQWNARHAGEPVYNLTAAIETNGLLIGELRVAGLANPVFQIRLLSDARMISNLLISERELETMTNELISVQDHLLALYELTRSVRSHLGIEETIQALAVEAAHLVNTEGSFIILNPTDVPMMVAHHPEPILEEATLAGLFQHLNASGHDLLMNSVSFPPHEINNLYLLSIPIRGDAVGALGLFNKANNASGGFTSADTKLARAIAEQSGAQIEKVLLYQETLNQAKIKTELELAAQIQLRLLPQSIPQVHDLELFARSIPARQVGGDFYNLLYQSDGSLTFTVGDVTGKGFSSALLMAMTRTAFRSRGKSSLNSQPSEMMRQINDDLYEDFTDVRMFCTLFVGQYQPRTRSILYANAGHSPVIFCPANEAARLLEPDDMPVGIMSSIHYQHRSIPFGSGDLLIVATDGFNEARNESGEMLGYKRLLELAKERSSQSSAQEIAEAFFNCANNFSGGRLQEDDQTLIIIKGK